MGRRRFALGKHRQLSGVLAVLLAAGVFVAAGCSKESGGEQASSNATENSSRVQAQVAAEDQHLPKVIDLGRGSCIPCKKMAPILAELKAEYVGRVIVEVIDVGEPGGRELAMKYRIRLIPTQIFFDADGNEVWRHQGFLPKEKIIEKLREMGVSG